MVLLHAGTAQIFHISLRWRMHSRARLLHCRSTFGQISKEVQPAIHLIFLMIVTLYLGDVVLEVPKKKNIKTEKQKNI